MITSSLYEDGGCLRIGFTPVYEVRSSENLYG
jgi:hypothetical protein